MNETLTREEFKKEFRSFNFLDERDAERVRLMSDSQIEDIFNQCLIDFVKVKGIPMFFLIVNARANSRGKYFDFIMSKAFKENFNLELFKLSKQILSKVVSEDFYTMIYKDLSKAIKFSLKMGFKENRDIICFDDLICLKYGG